MKKVKMHLIFVENLVNSALLAAFYALISQILSLFSRAPVVQGSQTKASLIAHKFGQ
ncbi:MAG: hypothetical protein L3J62_08575 [Gammaproteobacteria bacterium]|nr:hypothetical protein [Gammaproteobacteria bacterium]MCF6230829.1 hypothetical protein [Gammaproteobacteria bacterium]